MRRRRFEGRFAAPEDPLGAFGNLLDVMLVFACGLIAALVAGEVRLRDSRADGGARVEVGRELPEPPAGIGEPGGGFEAVGSVYRDPRTGKLILVGPGGETR